MKRYSIFLLVCIMITATSCKKDKDDDDKTNNNNSTYTHPTLNLDFKVTGDLTMDVNYTSPENNNTLGGHNNAVSCTYSSANNYWAFISSGTSSDGTTYSWGFTIIATSLSNGNYAVTQAQFGTQQNGFSELVSGTVNISNVKLGKELPVGAFYNASGNFSIQIQNQNTPVDEILFEGNFTGLGITAV